MPKRLIRILNYIIRSLLFSGIYFGYLRLVDVGYDAVAPRAIFILVPFALIFKVERINFFSIFDVSPKLKKEKVILCFIEWAAFLYLLLQLFLSSMPDLNKIFFRSLIMIFFIVSCGYFISRRYKKEALND